MKERVKDNQVACCDFPKACLLTCINDVFNTIALRMVKTPFYGVLTFLSARGSTGSCGYNLHKL